MPSGLTPDEAAAMDAEFARMAADAAKAAKPPEKSDKGSAPASPAAEPDKVAAGASESVTNGTSPEADKGEQPPATEGEFDTSFLPDDPDVRSGVKFTNPKAYAAIKNGVEAHATVTRLFQEKAVLAEKASRYDALLSHPKAAAKIARMAADIAEGKEPDAVEEPPAVPESDDDVLTRGDAKKMVRQEREAALAELQRPSLAMQNVNSAITAYATEHKVDMAVMQEAVNAARPALDQIVKGERHLNDVPLLLGLAVEVAKAKKPVAPPAPTNKSDVQKPTIPGTDTVASPVGRNGTHQTQSVPYPSHWKDGQPPARGVRLTDAQAEQEHLYKMRLRYGPNVTLEDIRIATGGSFR